MTGWYGGGKKYREKELKKRDWAFIFWTQGDWAFIYFIKKGLGVS